MPIQRKYGVKTDEPKPKLPHQIPDPPPPSALPETKRAPNIVSTNVSKIGKPIEDAEHNINSAIRALTSVDSDAAILAIGKLKGALQKLGLKTP
jgi:hypothetical protein